jgi:glutathione S-transferase
MKLYGSTTSPFVRRVRLFLGPRNYEFVSIQVFDPATRSSFKEISPLLKIPVLQDGTQVVYDSRVIFNYLARASAQPPLNWDQENLLTVMDEMAQSLLTVLLARRSEIILSADTPLGLSHTERISHTLEFLESQVDQGRFADWNFVSQTLYCYADWIVFRDLAPMRAESSLRSFLDVHRERPFVADTDPRRG